MLKTFLAVLFFLITTALFAPPAFAQNTDSAPAESASVDAASVMSSADWEEFLKVQTEITSRLRFFLNKTRPVLYGALALKHGLSKMTGALLFDSRTGTIHEELRLMMEHDRELYPEKYIKKTITEKTDLLIENIIRGVELNLQEEAPLISKSNEFSFAAALAAQAQAGSNSRKWGGLYDLGIGIGYNKTTKSFIFQIFRDKELFESTIIKAIMVGGVVLKAGLRISVVNEQSEKASASGRTFYPPFIPGFKSRTNNSYWFGFSSGLTFPPAPFGDALTYTNTISSKPLFRISFSPSFKGMMEFQQDNITKSLNYMRSAAAASGLRANRCAALFSFN